MDVAPFLETYRRHGEELLAMAIIRVIDPQPLRSHSSRREQLALSQEWDAYHSPNHLSTVRKET